MSDEQTPGKATDDDGPVGVVDLYIEALATFGNSVRDVAEHEWDLPTPCSDWNIKLLVAHVVLGEAQLPAVLGGDTTTTAAGFSVELLGPNPLATWRGTALRAIEAAQNVDVDQVLELDLGSVEVRQLLGYRITDNVVHAWDIGIGLARPKPLANRFGEWLLDFWQPKVDQIAGTETFAPPVTPVSDAPGDRLLALLGRTRPTG